MGSPSHTRSVWGAPELTGVDDTVRDVSMVGNFILIVLAVWSLFVTFGPR